MELNLKGKNVIITGANQGLGKNLCENFAAEGANIALNYVVNQDAAEAIVDRLKSTYGVKAVTVYADVTNEDDVIKMFKDTVSELGSVDVLVNNAGICPISLVKDMAYSEWQKVISVNLNGIFLTSREMVRYVLDNKRQGSIINIASQAAFNGAKRGKSHYSASKGGVVSFTYSLSREVARYGLRVNAVAPGMLYTEMTAATIDAEIEKYNESIALGRVGEMDEVSRAVLFLASDASSYITGSTMDVSGGIIGR